MAVKLDLLAAEQKENLVTLQNQFEVISGRLEILENCKHDLIEEIGSVKEKSDTDRKKYITMLMDTVREEIEQLEKEIASKDAVMSDNIGTMNHAMQEMMRNLLSLDESNRLIIAKLLLKDMEI
ncbi:MAG: hypothetical protein HFG89_06780 [Dorea sp.]|nr:hypothetical protein [Dorea sp.]